MHTPTFPNTYLTAQEYQRDVATAELEYYRAVAAFQSMPSAINFNRLNQAMINHQHLRLNAREDGNGMKASRTLSA